LKIAIWKRTAKIYELCGIEGNLAPSPSFLLYDVLLPRVVVLLLVSGLILQLLLTRRRFVALRFGIPTTGFLL
jgi:hypothetical protein